MNQRHALWSLLLTAGLPLLSCAAILLGLWINRLPRLYLALPATLCLLGLGLFLWAKFSIIAERHWVTFGSSRMTPRNRIYYRLGYSLLGIGALLSLLFVALYH